MSLKLTDCEGEVWNFDRGLMWPSEMCSKNIPFLSLLCYKLEGSEKAFY